jgi:hypothetical protein
MGITMPRKKKTVKINLTDEVVETREDDTQEIAPIVTPDETLIPPVPPAPPKRQQSIVVVIAE